MHERAGLYIHIPFCQQKCEYCDFYSVTQLERMEAFVQALIREIELRSPNFRDRQFQTVFFGGGTPSLLRPHQMESIWKALQRSFNIAEDGEFSLEANPGTLSHAKLIFLKSLGLNRLSMGVQSFQAPELHFLGRIHSVEEVVENFWHAREAGFQNINIDLMTAFPGITHQSFLDTLKRAAALRPEHISCYSLIFEPGTVFYKRMRRGELQPFSDDEEADYYEAACEYLGTHGYQQYEISNFARDREYRCQQNLIYWKHLPYLGFGPSAHSFDGRVRLANKRSLPAYIKLLGNDQLPIEFREELSPESLMLEFIFLGLRLREGIDLDEFRRRFGMALSEKYGATIRRLTEENLIKVDPHTLRLTGEGWLLADSVAANF